MECNPAGQMAIKLFCRELEAVITLFCLLTCRFPEDFPHCVPVSEHLLNGI